jgi:hypothetical protein
MNQQYKLDELHVAQWQQQPTKQQRSTNKHQETKNTEVHHKKTWKINKSWITWTLECVNKMCMKNKLEWVVNNSLIKQNNTWRKLATNGQNNSLAKKWTY